MISDAQSIWHSYDEANKGEAVAVVRSLTLSRSEAAWRGRRGRRRVEPRLA